MWYQCTPTGILIELYVQPGAKSTEIIGLHDKALKIRLKAPAIEGKANKALLKYLAQLFEVPQHQVELIHGEKTRRKRLKISNSKIDPKTLFKF